MHRLPIPVALIALAAPALVSPVVAAAGDADGGGQVTVMTFHERIIMRVPKVAPPPAEVTWKEKHGPKCIAAADLAGALVSEPGAVDLVLAGNHRVRARLDRACAPLDYYAGFYIKPAPDGQVCADRDSIRTRSGASCQIDLFRTLKPVIPKR